MTKKQWNSLSDDSKERLITEVFNSSYLAAVSANRKVEDNPILETVLKCTKIKDDTAHINIKKHVRIYFK